MAAYEHGGFQARPAAAAAAAAAGAGAGAGECADDVGWVLSPRDGGDFGVDGDIVGGVEPGGGDAVGEGGEDGEDGGVEWRWERKV